ncbi:MAG: hypothetical protein QOJ90_1668 [Actinomycetota bacterium]|jgi:DNA-binding MarR family transcriptional regulator|nr:hypothetical protein [Actinomycetota bacterium]
MKPSGVAFLLSQVGARTSTRFAERLAELGLSPAHAQVLRIVGQSPGLSQRALSERLGSVPSRVVRLVDELEAKGLVQRRPDSTDRRNHELHLNEGAMEQLAAVRQVVTNHDAAVVAALEPAEVQTLIGLLGRIAESLDLKPDVHPGSGEGAAT